MAETVGGIIRTRSGEQATIQSDDHYHAGSAGGTATVTLAAPSDGKSWVVNGFVFSCSDTPTAGALGIAATGTTSRSYKVTTGGPGAIKFPTPRVFPPNTAVAITYATGGGSGVPTLDVDAHKE